MEIRIRERYGTKTNIIYDVQVKRFLRWKTVSSHVYLDQAKEQVESIEKVEEFNKTKNKENKNPKLSFFAYGVRNQYDTGISSTISFFKEEPIYTRGTINKTDIFWNGNEIVQLKMENLFGDVGIEPRKYKITIEKIM